MKRILLTGIALVLVLLLALCGVVALQPAEFSISRSSTIQAPLPLLFEQVNTLKNWEAWSPWAKLDPNMKMIYSGAESGKGAVYTWEGDANVGAGKLAIIDSKPNERIEIQLDFYEPMEGTNATVFEFKQEGAGTVVTWTMSGKNNFIGKAFGLFMNMDAMVGGMFEQGLAQMAKAVEEK